MGLFRLVARVGRLRRRVTFVLEEWSPIPVRGEQNPAYRSPGIKSWPFALGVQLAKVKVYGPSDAFR